jgi:5-methylcytosine-specific restriction protein A
MIWILPANEKYYNHVASFKKNGFVDWAQHARFEVGDIVYMYVSAPTSLVTMKLEVEGTSIPFSKAMDDSEFWRDPSFFEKRKKAQFVRLRLLSDRPRLRIDRPVLLEMGVPGNIQGPRRIGDNAKLIALLSQAFGTEEIDYPDEVQTGPFSEGQVLSVAVNKYERNPEARAACIALKGCRCSICGFDFEKVYGPLGHNFIHVHHIVPLNQIGKNYVVDPAKDLIPVCPNCHAMLHHKKDDGTYPTVQELQALFAQKLH